MSDEAACENCGAPIVAASGESFMRMWMEDDDGRRFEAYYCVACTVQEPTRKEP